MLPKPPSPRFGVKFVDDVKSDLQHRNDDELRQAVERIEREALVAAIPGQHHDLALIIESIQPDQIAENDAVLVTGPERGRITQRPGVGKVDGDSGPGSARSRRD